MKKCFLWSIFMLSLLTFSCKDDDTSDPTDPVDPNPPVISINIDRGNDVTSNITGTVVDVSGESLEGVTVKVGNKTTITNEQGVFLMVDAPMKSKRTVVTFTKDGYFNSVKIVSANENKTSRVATKLLRKIKIGEFENKNGGLIGEGEGNRYSIKFDENAVENYSGKVFVFANYIDPTAEDFMLRNSGNMEAVNANSENGALISYGMLHVELQDENGTVLQLDKEKGATVTMKIPEDLKTTATEEMPLWSFNESEGVWIEEGKGILKDNSYYVGKVTHFSLWNYDAFINGEDYKCNIQFDFDIEDIENERLRVTVEVKTASGQIYRGSTNTDDEGKFETCLPTNILSYKIRAYNININTECSLLKEFTGTALSLTSVNKFIINKVDLENVSLAKFNGTLVNCNNEKVERGLVILTLPQNNGVISQEVFNGAFNLDNYICITNNSLKQAEVVVYDLTKGTKSFTKVVDLTNSNNITLSACETTTKIWPGDFDYIRDGQAFYDGEYTEIEGNARIGIGGAPVTTTRRLDNVDLIQRLEKIYRSLLIEINGTNVDFSGLKTLKSLNTLELKGNIKDIDFTELSTLNSLTLHIKDPYWGDDAPPPPTPGSELLSAYENIQFPKLSQLNVFSVEIEEYGSERSPGIKENSLDFPILSKVEEINLKDYSDRSGVGNPISLSMFKNVTSINSLSMSRLGNTDLKGLESAKIRSINISDNINLVDFCAISQDTINTITADNYSVSYNSYNPTLQDLKDGKCKQ